MPAMARRRFLECWMAILASAPLAHGDEKAASGFFAPAEEAPHARTWMCWPATASIYGGEGAYYESVQETIGRLAAAIALHEPVAMAVGAEHREVAARLCGPGVELVTIPTDDMWARDNGAVFLVDGRGKRAALDFHFNGWGGKQVHGRDAGIAAAMAAHTGCPLIASVLTGEGGGIEVDGEGTLLLNDSCWENDNRNPGMDRAGIEAALKAELGVEKVIWLPGKKGGDITDDHIDGCLRAVRPGVLLASGIEGDTSEWGVMMDERLAILRAATDARGRTFTIAEVPWAEEGRSHRQDFFSGYANYYVGNGAVYTPQFGDPARDRHAAETLAALYPDRKVVVLEMDRIYENGGGIHCVTQQEPVA